jgi:carbamoyl-phosphate synthase small subunit
MSDFSVAKKAVLVLEDGTVFSGYSAGKVGTTIGEICFNTGMTGYQEIFTDPSYFGQILVSTNVHIGNYGTTNEDTESSKMKISGLVTKRFSTQYSRKLAEESIEDYFIKEGLVAITDIDTRAVVQYIRSKGAMNAIISSETTDIDELLLKLKSAPNMEGLELASKVTTEVAYETGKQGLGPKIAALDFGIKQNILDCLVERGCHVKIFPAKSTFEELQSFSPDGYFLSNGPGDPASMDYAISTVKDILKEGKPLFGICLGHQLLALALDVPTYKMHHGHRGINHPVMNLQTGKSEITSQNHGFCVDPDALRNRSSDIEITHVNLNDDTIEGIRLRDKPAFSVQYHPEAAPGPHDSRYLFDDFVQMFKN